ncbi:MAG: SoxR reducing system RseC family protein [Bacteroidales bacterium]|nr:SoxR reducing system RseC family protein [Bacteroidales bacterium]
MANRKVIEHEGIVREVRGTLLTVEILSKSACSGCEARSLCSSSEQKTKLVETEAADGETYSIDEEVVVVGSESMGIVAVVLCYVVPVVLMVVMMAVLGGMGQSDVVCGLAAIGVLVPYFCVIYLLRDTLKRNFKFKTKKINK